MTERGDAPAQRVARRPLKQRLSALFEEYGRIGLITYLTLSVLAIGGFSIAFGIGFGSTHTTGVLGAIVAGWLAAKATLPLRILITLGVTPIVAYVLGRRRRPVAEAEAEAGAETEAAAHDAADATDAKVP